MRAKTKKGKQYGRTEQLRRHAADKDLREWCDAEESKIEIETKEDRTAARVSGPIDIDGQDHRLFIETDETNQLLSVFVYSPYKVKPARMGDMARILNRINIGLSLGRLACYDDDEDNPVQFLARIDIEGGQLGKTQIGTMISAAGGTFDDCGQLLAAVALTRQPVDLLWKQYLEERADKEAKRRSDGNKGPSEL